MGKISIIDDELAVRKATGSLVRSLGFEARAFGSAEEFLASPAALDSDCIISDVQMPGMGGIGLYQELVRRRSAIPFIFITAFSEEGVRQKLGQRVRILHKPFKADLLAGYIENAIGSDGTPA
ncbi:response regulator [Xanthobacter sp. DSM 24535]|uniref:response regulator transcription factor n=1 Tax=Roseixanthobacter psychrophilus TaxID=3119917 RepID=UPI003726C9E0